MKICKRCKQQLAESEFPWLKSAKRYATKCKPCFKAYNSERAKQYHQKNRSKRLATMKERHKTNIRKVLEHYGNQCSCCGEKEKIFLTVDHINNDGYRHRVNGSKNSTDTTHQNIYNFLVRNNFPTGFQILCYNCNAGKHRNNGVCPHKTMI